MDSSETIASTVSEEEDDITTNEHKAIEGMMLMFKTTDYPHSNEFLDICTALEASPAFREFSEGSRICSAEAAQLIIAGGMYQRLVKQS